MIERKSLALQVKQVDDSGFAVYAAVFGNVDHQGDLIEPGAFANLDGYLADGVVLLGHDMNALPVGYPVSAMQDETGLLVGGKWHSTSKAQEARTIARERMEAGKSVGASIGYEVLEWRSATVEDRQVRVISKLNVYEFSFVNIPANPEARAVAVKNLSDLEQETATLLLDAKAGRKSEASKRLDGVKGFGERIKRIAAAMAEAEKLLGLDSAMADEEEKPADEALEEAMYDDDEKGAKFDGPEGEEEEEDDEEKAKAESAKSRLNLLHKLRLRSLQGRSLDLAAIDAGIDDE